MIGTKLDFLTDSNGGKGGRGDKNFQEKVDLKREREQERNG